MWLYPQVILGQIYEPTAHDVTTNEVTNHKFSNVACSKDND